jgi:hypothetical protein
MPVADFTRLFCQPPELFRLVPGSFRRESVFHKQTGLLGTLTAFVAIRSHALGLLAFRLLIHDIHLPAA